jgi:hypothetical protein
MRIGFLVVGVVLVLLAAILMFVPLITVSTATISSEEVYTANVTGYSIVGTVAGSLSWTSTAPVTLSFVTCSVAATPTGGGYTCPGTGTSTNETGTSGSFAFALKSGGEIGAYFSGPSGASTSISVKLAQDTIGFILLVVGVLLFLAGLVLKHGAKPAPAVPPATPATPPGS